MPGAAFMAEILEATAAVDEVMAEPWLLKPTTSSAERTAPVMADTSRPSVIFAGTFIDPQAKPDLANSYDRRQVRRPGEDSGHPRLMISPAAIAAATLPGPALVIRQGDNLVRQFDGVTWRVASVFTMAGGTLQLVINIVG